MPPWTIQVCQVASMLLFAPLISGVIAKLEAQLQSRQGPSVLQPYFDIAKFFRKETLRPESSSPFFEVAPVIAVAAARLATTCWRLRPAGSRTMRIAR